MTRQMGGLALRALAPVCLLLLVVAMMASSAEAWLPQKIDVRGASFSLTAELLIKFKNDKFAARVMLEEWHSAWQWKSRLDFQAEGAHWGAFLTRTGTFFSDAKQAFEVDRVFESCRRVDQAEINRALKMEFAKLDEPSYMIGTARLLHYIEQNSEHFQLQEQQQQQQQSSGGQAGSIYTATLGRDASNSSDWSTIQVEYAAVGDDAQLERPLGVPTRVLVTKPDGYQLLFRPRRVARLAPYEPIYSGSSVARASQRGAGSAAAGELAFDVFAVERALGCAKDSLWNDEHDVTLGNEPLYRFSFSAKLLADGLQVARSVPLVVGYEPELETLRVDQQLEGRTSEVLVSYRHDRAYSVVRRHTHTTSTGVLALDRLLGASGPEQPVTCVVTKASTATRMKDTCRNPHTLGQMLLGTSGKVTYLGLARVRGIEAMAFECHDSQPPVWLEQPSVFQSAESESSKQDEQLKWRYYTQEGETYPTILSTVYYFTRGAYVGGGPDQTNGQLVLLDNKLLLVELFKVTRRGTHSERLTIPIYEFTWDLQRVAPNGERTEDFFSLANECLALATQDNHYARLSLELRQAPAAAAASGGGQNNNNNNSTQSETSQIEWLRTGTKRNLALVRALNDQLGVQPPVLHDLESRYVGWGATDGAIGGDEFSLLASMWAAERQEAPVQLVYLGRATFPTDGFDILTVLNFQACYQLASHRQQVDTLFAYNAFMTTCYIYRRPAPASADKLDSMLLKSPASFYEVYQVVHRGNRKLLHDDYVTRVDGIRARAKSTGRLLLVDPSLTTSTRDDSRPRVAFSLGEVEVRHLDEKTAYDLDEAHLDDINKFSGLGLVPGIDEQNKLVEPRQTSLAPMTFEQCHEACLVDLECESYSTCVVGGALQCVLSSVNFRESTTVIELMMLLQQEQGAKLGQVFEIKLSTSQSEGSDAATSGSTSGSETEQQLLAGGTIHVKRHPTCELHNKLYGDFFRDAGQALVNLKGRLLRPVTNPDQCAEICLLGTLATMRKEARRAKPNARGEAPTEGHSAGHCGHYFYLERDLVERKSLKIEPEQVIGVNTDGATRGYCLFDDGSLAGGRNSKAAANLPRGGSSRRRVELRKRELDFALMYERQHGLSLAESERNYQEEEAYNRLRLARGPEGVDRETLEVLVSLQQRGSNLGYLAPIRPADAASECARMCFTQMTPLWPACRSFELLELLETETALRRTFCAFNTATLEEARGAASGGGQSLIRQGNEAQERIRMRPGVQVQVWHFEPRVGLAANSVRDRFRVSLGALEELEREEHTRGWSALGRVRVGALVLALAVGVAVTLGLVAGLWLERRPETEVLAGLLNRITGGGNRARGARREDNEILVPDLTALEREEGEGERERPEQRSPNGTTPSIVVESNHG